MAVSAVVIARFASIKSGQVNPAILKKAFAYLLYSIAILTIAQTWI
jgi:hypothetical protein